MIIDASVAIPWLITTPFSTSARRLRPERAGAPSLLLVETANVLLKYRRLSGIQLSEVEAAMEELRIVVPDLVADPVLLPAAFRIAAEHNHKVYDCLYLALAMERREPLATADKKLAALAGRLGIPVELIAPSP